MELRRLTAEDYDELLEMLNSVFANTYGREMDFLNEQPKMWIRDDKHMGYHFGIFEDGRLVSVSGIYPLCVRTGDTSLLFATTGNVATRPEYEGRGYFTKIFTEIMKELENIGADAARLGGSRPRYGRFGFEPAACSYVMTVKERNRIKHFGNAGADITFREIERGDTEALSFCHELSKKANIYVERSTEDGYRDVYLALCSKHSSPYLALRDGEPIGYLAAYADNQFVGRSQNGRHIAELRTVRKEDYAPVISAWQRHTDSVVTVGVAPHMTEELRTLAVGADEVAVRSPSHFKILNYEKIADALIKLKAREKLPCGELIIGIKDYGNIRLYVTENAAGCERTERAASLTLDRLAATRLLFGHLPASVTAPSNPLIASWLPLPLSWDTLDYV